LTDTQTLACPGGSDFEFIKFNFIYSQLALAALDANSVDDYRDT
jgi:hypothetical protein